MWEKRGEEGGELQKERQREGKKMEEGNKSLTSSAHCDTLTLLSFVDQ